MLGFCAVKSDMILSSEPAGSSAPHHCANSSVTGPPADSLELPPELHPAAVTATAVAAATTANSRRLGQLCNLASPADIASPFLQRCYRSLRFFATLTTCSATSQDAARQGQAQ